MAFVLIKSVTMYQTKRVLNNGEFLADVQIASVKFEMRTFCGQISSPENAVRSFRRDPQEPRI